MRDQTTITAAIPVGDIPRDEARTFLNVFATDGEEEPGITVTISGGTPFHIEPGKSWGPMPAPMNDIEFSGTGVLLYTGSLYN